MANSPSISSVKRAAIISELTAIAEANNGFTPAAKIVEAASDEASILHDFFEWDDGAAAHSYRLAQADLLVRRVRFNVLRQDNADPRRVSFTTARAYQSRPSARSKDGGYELSTDILSDPEKREEMLQQVLRELDAYRKRYSEIMALSGVWHAIDDAVDALSNAPSRQGIAGQERQAGAPRG